MLRMNYKEYLLDKNVANVTCSPTSSKLNTRSLIILIRNYVKEQAHR